MADRGPVRVSPESVDYRKTKPGSLERCFTCSMFRPGGLTRGSCTLVTGPIAAAGICDRYEPRVTVGL